VVSVTLTPEQAGVVRSNGQFQQLYGGGAHAIIFNLHLPDALPPRLLNPRALSEMLGVSRRTVLKLTRSGVLKSYKIGRLRRFSVEDVIEYLGRSVAADKNTVRVSRLPE
jgi:excisionase family DNA binding protein